MKGYRYDQAMKVVKLKQMAKTLIYLEEKGLADFDALVNAAADAEKRFYDLKAAIKAAEARMSEIQTLRTHIMNYSRTRNVYTGYYKDFARSWATKRLLRLCCQSAKDRIFQYGRYAAVNRLHTEQG